MSVMDQLKRLDEQRAALLDTAKTAALEKANEAVADLNALGFHYQLVQQTASITTLRMDRTPNDAPCPICSYKTTPLHDRRSHKGHPEPFTDEELRARNLVKVQGTMT